VSTDIHVAIEKVDIHHGPDMAAALAVITETLQRIEGKANSTVSTTVEILQAAQTAQAATSAALENIAADIDRLQEKVAALPTDTAEVEALATAIRDNAMAMATAAAAVAADEPEDAPAEPPVDEAPAEEAPAEEAPVEEAPVEEVPADPPVDEPAEAPAE
jgi:hypothetical protein